MPIYSNIDGSQKELKNIYVNIGGAQKELSNAYANVDGAQKELFSKGKQFFSIALGSITQTPWQITQGVTSTTLAIYRITVMESSRFNEPSTYIFSNMGMPVQISAIGAGAWIFQNGTYSYVISNQTTSSGAYTTGGIMKRAPLTIPSSCSIVTLDYDQDYGVYGSNSLTGGSIVVSCDAFPNFAST